MVRWAGWILIVIGLGQMFYAGGMSVESPTEPGIANTDLMEQRLLYLLGGCTAFLAGTIGVAAAQIVKAIRDRPPET